MVDNYGNYFCQKLLSACSAEQRFNLLQSIRADFFLICTSQKGTHSIQRFIEMVSLEREEQYFREVLAGHVSTLALDAQGTHVVQNIIQFFPEDRRQFLFDECLGSFYDICTNNYGLCVIKILLQKTTIEANRRGVVREFMARSIELAQDPYGNYAIQTAI